MEFSTTSPINNSKSFFQEVSGQPFPKELTRYIFTFLDPISLAKSSICDKSLHYIAEDQSLWKKFFINDYTTGRKL